MISADLSQRSVSNQPMTTLESANGSNYLRPVNRMSQVNLSTRPSRSV